MVVDIVTKPEVQARLDDREQDERNKAALIAGGLKVEAPRVIRYRRMPALFPATDRAWDLMGSAVMFVNMRYPGLSEAEADMLTGRLAAFAEELREPSRPCDGDKQRACDEAHGHVLKVDGNDITCTTCNARWQGVPY